MSHSEINARKRGGAVTMCGNVYDIITVKKNVNVSSLEQLSSTEVSSQTLLIQTIIALLKQ